MSSSSKKVIVSAVQPTNKMTLGNYLGAIKNWVRIHKDYQCYFFAVDLHAITSKQNAVELRENTFTAVAYYLASGIDLKHAHLFPQSAVPQHAELAWVLNCFSYMGELGRMTQYKDKSARAGESIPVGLFTYPVLMAADILLYQANLVPVGADQKQHLELTRDLAGRMNGLYGPLFKIPEPMIAESGAKIMDLQEPDSKMSKSASSDLGAIFLSDSPKDIEKKFKRAVTDSGTEIACSDDRPGVKNLLEIQSCITGTSIPELVNSYSGKMYGHLKVETAELVIAELKPIQEAAARYLADRGELLRILRSGADQARSVADQTLKSVYDAIGFINLR